MSSPIDPVVQDAVDRLDTAQTAISAICASIFERGGAIQIREQGEIRTGVSRGTPVPMFPDVTAVQDAGFDAELASQLARHCAAATAAVQDLVAQGDLVQIHRSKRQGSEMVQGFDVVQRTTGDGCLVLVRPRVSGLAAAA